MDVTTQLSKAWKRRQLMMAALLCGFGLYCFYDGRIDWPAKNARYTAHKQIMDQADVPFEQKEAQWAALTKEKGWPPKPPEKMYSDMDLKGQFGMGAVTIACGLASLAWLWMSGRQQLFAKDGVIHAASGGEVPYSAVYGTDRRKWDAKGIAYLLYRHDGKEGKLTIDDYKFEGAEAILLHAEKLLGIEPPAPEAEEPEEPTPGAQ